MPLIQPDTSAAQDMSPIEPGTYPATIVACETQNSKKGNPMIVPKLEVMVDGKKRTRNTYIVTSGEGAGNFDQLLRACHMEALADQYKDPTATKPDFDTDTLIGQQFNVVIESQLYEGQKRDQIKTYLKA